jgi:hypothetical protein
MNLARADGSLRQLSDRNPDHLHRNPQAIMRMVVTTPNVFRQRRPAWLGPFNFFLFPMLSETFGGYPTGFDKSTFVFITPYESSSIITRTHLARESLSLLLFTLHGRPTHILHILQAVESLEVHFPPGFDRLEFPH